MTTGPMTGILNEAEKKNREHIREQWAQHGILPRLKPWWQMCRICKTQGLWAPQSQQRGICERCWIDAGNPTSIPAFTGDPECWRS